MEWWKILIGASGLGLILDLILKQFISNELIEKWSKGIKVFFKGLGIVSTVGLSKIPYLKNIWNNFIEPYVIILLKMVFTNAIEGFIEGLETDNRSLKDD